MMYDWGYGGGMGAGGWVLMSLVSLLIIAALVVGILALVRYTSTPSPSSARPAREGPVPEEILRLRLARGEIEPEEYERRLAALRSGALS